MFSTLTTSKISKRTCSTKTSLHAAAHPDIGFVGQRCEHLRDGRLRVQGELTVRGVSQPLQLPMTVDQRQGVLTARGEFTLTHAAFGFEPYSAAFGALANDDWLRFTVEIVARRRLPPPPPPTRTATTAPPAKAKPKK